MLTAVVPGHLHELEDVRDGQYRLVVVAENRNHPRFPFFESFGTADCHRASMASFSRRVVQKPASSPSRTKLRRRVR
jgi:hypothetical protein